jgi:hypothetical protein
MGIMEKDADTSKTDVPLRLDNLYDTSIDENDHEKMRRITAKMYAVNILSLILHMTSLIFLLQRVPDGGVVILRA